MPELDRQEEADRDIPNKVSQFIHENYVKISVVLGVGTAAGLMNINHGLMAIISAGLKQCAYSGASAMVLFALYNNLAKRARTLPSELIPIVVPILLTIAANYGVHSLRGTAEPALSTLPTAIVVTLGFPAWHIRTRILELQRMIEEIKIEL